MEYPWVYLCWLDSYPTGYVRDRTTAKEKTPVIPAKTPEIDIDQLAAAVSGGAAIVDVREPGEYLVGHVPGAVLIPMGQLPSRTAELDREAPVYVVCASGNRSAVMTDFLRSAGFDAYSAAGGTSGWARSGRPVVGGPALRA
jgi:rhodanese-related sulfurtransferase